MKASFLSKLNKQFRGAIALSFLLISLLGSHWIGFHMVLTMLESNPKISISAVQITSLHFPIALLNATI
jgi:hypothetical protein